MYTIITVSTSSVVAPSKHGPQEGCNPSAAASRHLGSTASRIVESCGKHKAEVDQIVGGDGCLGWQDVEP